MTAPAECINSPYGQRITRKTVTFSNTSGTVNLFTVTGVCLLLVYAMPTIDLVSIAGASVSVGTAADASVMGSDMAGNGTAGTALTLDGFYPTPGLINYDSVWGCQWLFTGQDLILTLSDQVDSGELEFYCLWTPLSTDGNVEAA